MPKETKLYETKLYRCLVYQEKQTDSIYLMLCGIESCLPGYKFHAGDRTGYHLHVIFEGKGTLYVDGASHSLHFGQMFITKPGEETWYQADEEYPWSYCWMTFDGENAIRYVENAGFRKGTNWRDCRADQAKFYDLVKRVLDHPEMTLANDLLRLGYLLEFLALAVESNTGEASPVRRENAYSADVYVDYAMTYIQSNAATAKISDVARYIGINRSYLTSIFKKKMGISPQEYLMQCKLNGARRLLIETEVPIQEVAHRVGYENPLTFSKIFKNFYGVSPKLYRANHRQEPESMHHSKKESNRP